MQGGFDPTHGVANKSLTLKTFFIKLAGNFLIGIGVQEAEGQIFELPLEFPYAQTIRQRRQQFQRFPGHPFTRRRRMLGIKA